MPRNTREWAHRKIGQARGQIDWCGAHLQEVKEVYEPSHPEIASVLQSGQELLAMLDQMLEALVLSF